MNPAGHPPAGYSAIDDYGILGDCRSAALVSRAGSIDWLCWPRLDSPSVFGALLDPAQGGYFAIRPARPVRTARRYIGDSNAIETVFHGNHGSLALRDVMVITPDDHEQKMLSPEHELLRVMEGLSGEIDVTIAYEPRPDYGRGPVALAQRGELGIQCDGVENGLLVLRSEVPLQIAADRRSATSTLTIHAGQRYVLSLSYGTDGPAIIPVLGGAAHERFAKSVSWWQAWADQCTYEGAHRDAVLRSVLALKLMCFAPSGAVIAAPTTSLPEVPGSDHNWDYRYCWLRDASLTVHALQALGYMDEAAAYCGWLLHATRLSWPELQILYDVFGETRLTEKELRHLAGYERSRPVRVGNGAYAQRQLDVYGEVVDAVTRLANAPEAFDRDTVRLLNGIGRTVCKQWREPDSGIWESRAGPQHYTYSKVLCWVALDRLVTLARRFGLHLDVETFARERDAIRAMVETRGYSERLGSYTQVFDGTTVDASLLTLSWYGYHDARHPRLVSTVRHIADQLGRGALVYRYEEPTGDGSVSDEGAFGICSFWMVDAMARAGDLTGARHRFERLLGYANDLGLYAEEIDPATGSARGNFPQAFTHVGLINAALALDECHEAISRGSGMREAGM
jgi:GH15 family glucan-1,4-alpha-glucosidase